MTTICIVGHRDVRKEDYQFLRNEILKVLNKLKADFKDIKTFSLVASGADTIFYEVAKAAHIPIEVLLPFQIKAYKKDFTERDDLRKFKAIIVNEKLEGKKPLKILKTHSKTDRDNAYWHAGKHLVDISDFVVALWDGEKANGTVGTAKIVEYALEMGKDVRVIPTRREDSDLKFLETEANRNKIAFKTVWIIGIALGLLSVFCFAPTLFFPMQPQRKLLLSLAELFCLPFSYFLLCHCAKNQKNHFLDKRIAAERRRVSVVIKDAGIDLDRYQDSDAKSDDGENIQGIKDIGRAKDDIVSFIDNQIKYHGNSRVEKYKQYEKSMRRVINGVLIAFFVVVSLNFWYELGEARVLPFKIFDNPKVLHLLWVLIPAFYAALEVVYYFQEWKLNISISEKIIDKLNSIKTELDHSDADGFMRKIRELLSLVEIENEDWKRLINSKHIGPYI